jgi:ArsR family transcriptional regulator
MCHHLARDINLCQYRYVSNSLVDLPVIQTPSALACCAPLAREPMTTDQAEQVSGLLKAIADPVRLRLMSLVLSHEGGEACVCDLNDAFDLSQPTISHHLKVLHEAGLLDREKRGVWVYYKAKPDAMTAMTSLFVTGNDATASC